MSGKIHSSQKNISSILAGWYAENKRDLPWRDVSDPYKIWVSEIILQQTRVIQGIGYYYRFIQAFPDVESLSLATEDKVLKLWQGLGYYTRARNLRFAAIQIMNEHDGHFPSSFENILKLKGVGEYTASAISSMAFNQPFAVVDGNVARVLSRFFCIDAAVDTPLGLNQIKSIANEILDRKNPGLHNQAVMEFGALMCVPQSPDCENCPLNNACCALHTDRVETLPIKSKKTVIKSRFFNYLCIKLGEFIFIDKREGNDVWRNMYEFPLIEADRIFSKDDLINDGRFQALTHGIEKVEIGKKSKTFRHQLTHQIIHACLFQVKVSQINAEYEHYIRIKVSDLEKYPVSRLIELLVENNKCS